MGRSKEIYVQMQDDLMKSIGDAEIGNVNHIDTLLYLRECRSKIQEGLDLIKSYETENEEYIKAEIQEYPEGYGGYDFELRNGRTMFSYKHIPEWQTYDKNKKDCEARYKAAFMARQKNVLVATEDGEEIIMPEVSYGKGSIVLKKKR